MRKINVKTPLNSVSKVVVKHRPIWMDEIDETDSGQVIEATICAKCGRMWGVHE